MNDRKIKQPNFQLILITHDEKFLELLHRHALGRIYYRVSKDPGYVSKSWGVWVGRQNEMQAGSFFFSSRFSSILHSLAHSRTRSLIAVFAAVGTR